MREIKTHRTGGSLNEALRLECDDESGKYHVLVRAHGEWGPKLKLEFQKGDFAEDKGGPSGISDEVLLAVLIDRAGRMPASPVVGQTMYAVKLEEALLWLAKRKEEGK